MWSNNDGMDANWKPTFEDNEPKLKTEIERLKAELEKAKEREAVLIESIDKAIIELRSALPSIKGVIRK